MIIKPEQYASIGYNDCLKNYTIFSFKEDGVFRFIHQSNPNCTRIIDCPGNWVIEKSDSLKINYTGGGCSVSNLRNFNIVLITEDLMRLQEAGIYASGGTMVVPLVIEYTFIPK